MKSNSRKSIFELPVLWENLHNPDFKQVEFDLFVEKRITLKS